MTKSQLLFVSATMVLGVAAVFRWYAVPSTHAATDHVAESQRSGVHEPPPTSPSPDSLPMASPSITAPDPLAREMALMQQLRSVKSSDPARAVELARDGNRQFPDTSAAPERTSILIHALALLNRPSEARGQAEQMVNHYPDSDWVREIESFTGAHRHRNIRVNDEGSLEYYDP